MFKFAELLTIVYNSCLYWVDNNDPFYIVFQYSLCKFDTIRWAIKDCSKDVETEKVP